ncbi:glycerophosphodiester phosphodiesterase family protein [Microbacterium sp. NM3R9]|uniref:glycerophosphodiester phosphodiesterase family protein n=1 Tax=Microbacterium thalli TaxID=3027921 RepID=UPI002366C788|nr:glycerophosphodiester phosphodiesterase family protein [Microbacterium thalli]MDN8549705.1 glycerophosphodiester phosphodiesterase family protein [Microbacterium thalli]
MKAIALSGISPLGPSLRGVTRPLVIGHRGAPGYRPEHTRSSYLLALDAGADAVEPDIVFSRDGVAIVRHENEIGSTTDVAEHERFRERRTTKTIDGVAVTGWFAEDFSWDELAQLRCRERVPQLRPDSARHDGAEPMLRLRDVLDLVAHERERTGRAVGVVLEIKHATFLASVGFDVAALVAAELRDAGWDAGQHPLWVESFELDILDRLGASGVAGTRVFLLEATGAPFDRVAADGAQARTYDDWASPAGLAELHGRVDGISVDKRMILAPGRSRQGGSVVADAHARGLSAFTWTARPENAFLVRRHRRAGGPAAWGDYASEWAELAASGIDGVFVDHPDLGVAVFGRKV